MRKRRIAYVNRRPFDILPGGQEENAQRLEKLVSWAAPSTAVSIRSVKYGPASIESMYEEYLSIPPTADVLVELAAEQFDAAIVGCFADPGLDGLREISDMPVIGPGTAAMALAVTLGHRYTILTVTGGIAHGLRRLSWEAGTEGALASVRYIDASVAAAGHDRSVIAGMVELGKAAISQDGADVLILGCMSMAFLDVAEEMSQRLGVPVINPARAALSLCEATLAMGLRHSRVAYPRPIKLGAGGHLDELTIGRA